ncbi:MAG: amidoligase family protein [Pseudomonadota bacterium]
MPLLSDLPRDRFLPLPEGADRACGFEIEFGGINVDDAACVARDLLGGTIDMRGVTATLKDTDLGSIEIYPDSAFASKLESYGLMPLVTGVVPVELVTEPLTEDQLTQFDALCTALAAAGATGTREGVFLGYGLHLNIALTSRKADDMARIATAFALMDDSWRAAGAVDLSRRLTPFVSPFPRKLVDWLVATPEPELVELRKAVLRHSATRNRALDLLPAIAALSDCEELVPGEKLKPRPAFHTRLPDARLGDDRWSVALEWNRWVMVEHVANHTRLMPALRKAWQRHRADWFKFRAQWPRTFERLVSRHAPELRKLGAA